jgi:cysteine desulfuration protein SufE
MLQILDSRIKNLLHDLKAIDDRELRFELLIEYADRFVEVPKTTATRPFAKHNKVPACESDAYAFVSKNEDGSIQVNFAVENPQGISAKALAVILSETLNGTFPQEVEILDEQIVHEIFGRTISMGKGQGLMGMVRLTKELCRQLNC